MPHAKGGTRHFEESNTASIDARLACRTCIRKVPCCTWIIAQWGPRARWTVGPLQLDGIGEVRSDNTRCDGGCQWLVVVGLANSRAAEESKHFSPRKMLAGAEVHIDANRHVGWLAMTNEAPL